MARRVVLAVWIVLLAGCAEPFIVFAGGSLSGNVELPPVDWAVADEEDVVQLETRPSDPYSINIWAVVLGPHLYVATSEDGTRWTEHLADSRDVRLRVKDVIYELEAVAVTAPEERAAVAQEYVDKYDVDEDDNWVAAGKIYRLDRR
jgi:hypothetical protein